MTTRMLGTMTGITAGFFAAEAFYALESFVRAFFCRAVVLSIELVAIFLLAQSIAEWPAAAAKVTGEEMLVMQGEFQAAQERDREVQRDLRNEVSMLWVKFYEMRDRMTQAEAYDKRMEEKFDSGVKILWGISSLLILQVIVPLARLLLTREINRVGKGPVPNGRVDRT